MPDSKRHGLIHFRSIKIVHLGIVSLNAIMKVNERVPCAGTIEDLY
jgi:hypothetical protein